MRINSNSFAEGSGRDLPSPFQMQSGRPKQIKLKGILKDCREIIFQLQNENQKLQVQLKQKETIISKLIEDKQSHIIHMANCNSEELINKIQASQIKQNQMVESFKEMSEKYEALIEKNRVQIQKLKSFNRALRIDNNHLREGASEDIRNRRVGSITNSNPKDLKEVNSFSFTKINQRNIEEQFSDKFTVFPFETPQRTFKETKSTALPSTEHSAFRQISSQDQNSKKKQIPLNLFSNQYIRQFRNEPSEESSPESCFREKRGDIDRVMKRIMEILAQSEDDSY